MLNQRTHFKIFFWVLILWTLTFNQLSFGLESESDLRSETMINSGDLWGQRFLLNQKASQDFSGFHIFVEGFLETDSPSKYSNLRDDDFSAELQELYIDYSWKEYFFRLGRQSLRWSDSWLLPSLDIWTARRWNRFFLDPEAQQFIHSDALWIAATFDRTHIEAVASWKHPENQLPESLSFLEEESEERVNFGLKVKQDWDKLQAYAIGARIDEEEHWGFGLNYPIESVILKAEAGHVFDSKFASIGIDYFGPEVSLVYQSVYFENLLESRLNLNQWLHFLKSSWTKNSHEVGAQFLWNTEREEGYLDTYYQNQITEEFEIKFITQFYEGKSLGLFNTYKQSLKGAPVFLLRLRYVL